MNTISTSSKSLLGGLLVSFFLFSLFIPAFQAQATVGGSCATSTCSPVATCRSLTDNPATPPPAIEGGICIGPCTTNTECDSVKNAFGWGGAKCTGTPEVAAVPAGQGGTPPAVAAVAAVNGVCLELPRSESRLKDEALVVAGAQLLTVIDTVTNWFFAVFTIIAVIMIILAAFQFVTAGGDAEKVSEARQKLIWAAVGIIVALASKALVPVIRAIVGG